MPPREKYHNNATPKKIFLTRIYPLLSDLDPVTLKLTLKIFLIKELFEVQKGPKKGKIETPTQMTPNALKIWPWPKIH